MNLVSIRILFIILLNFLFGSSWILASAIPANKANEPTFIAGEHFKVLSSKIRYPAISIADSIPDKSKYKPQVIMFFNYGCFGCRQINQEFNKWKQLNSNKIDIYRCPVAFNKPWENLAKLYYVQQELFPNDDGEKIFSEIYDSRKQLWLEQEMVNFYERYNISKDVFFKKYLSFDVDRKVKKAIEIAAQYKVIITPNVIINGKNNSYMVNFSMVQDPETLFKVINYLVKANPK
ncbi:MAG: thioredoxin domain-containing protein [Gammaproteobacteria bacterium]